MISYNSETKETQETFSINAVCKVYKVKIIRTVLDIKLFTYKNC